MSRAKAIFLDRDGVLNYNLMREGQLSSPRQFQEFKLLPNTLTNLNKFKKLGFLLIVITNQPDVARGFMPKYELDQMHQYLMETLPLNAIYTCLHDHQDHCECRKPKPGALLKAAQIHHIDLNQSYMIGDRAVDIQAGQAAGCKTILVSPKVPSSIECEYHIQNLDQAYLIISGEIA